MKNEYMTFVKADLSVLEKTMSDALQAPVTCEAVLLGSGNKVVYCRYNDATVLEILVSRDAWYSVPSWHDVVAKHIDTIKAAYLELDIDWSE